MKSAVDRLDKKSGKYFQLARVDVHTDFGSRLKKEVGSQLVPAFILYGSNGVEISRFHSVPDLGELKSSLRGRNKG